MSTKLQERQSENVSHITDSVRGLDSLLASLNLANRPEFPLLDREIKLIREHIFLHSETVQLGINHWKNICKLSVSSQLCNLQNTLKRFGISYRSITDKTLFPDNDSVPEWSGYDELVRSFGLGTSDAAILNMARCNGNVHGVITNDVDMIELFRAGGFVDHIQCYTMLKKHCQPVAA